MTINFKFLYMGVEMLHIFIWFKWDLVLNYREYGGLGIGSLEAFNLALLYKWR